MRLGYVLIFFKLKLREIIGQFFHCRRAILTSSSFGRRFRSIMNHYTIFLVFWRSYEAVGGQR